jgi:hypothetical protein
MSLLLLHDWQLNTPNYYNLIMNQVPSLYWRLGESSGTTIADSSGNGRDGTISGAGYVLNQAGAPNSAVSGGNGSMEFTGNTATHVDAAYDPWPTAGPTAGARTVTGWALLDALSGQHRAIMVGSTDNTNNTLFFRQLNTSADGAFDFDFGFNGTTVNDVNLSAGQWFHWAWQIDTDNDIVRIYFNGALANEQLGVTAGWPALAAGFRIGKLSTASAPWDGKIDEVAIFDRMLSADEIAQQHRAGTWIPTYASGAFIKIGGVFVAKPVRMKSGGTFVTKPAIAKEGGSF